MPKHSKFTIFAILSLLLLSLSTGFVPNAAAEEGTQIGSVDYANDAADEEVVDEDDDAVVVADPDEDFCDPGHEFYNDDLCSAVEENDADVEFRTCEDVDEAELEEVLSHEVERISPCAFKYDNPGHPEVSTPPEGFSVSIDGGIVQLHWMYWNLDGETQVHPYEVATFFVPGAFNDMCDYWVHEQEHGYLLHPNPDQEDEFVSCGFDPADFAVAVVDEQDTDAVDADAVTGDFDPESLVVEGDRNRVNCELLEDGGYKCQTNVQGLMVPVTIPDYGVIDYFEGFDVPEGCERTTEVSVVCEEPAVVELDIWTFYPEGKRS